MRERVGLSVGATNLVAARADGSAIVRKAAVSWRGTVLSGFVERFGDPVPMVAADGSVHAADRLMVEALADISRAHGGGERTSVAVPAHWQPHLVDRMRALLPDATVTSDAVAALTALRRNPGLPARGIVALFDFGATGTTITLADAAADFRAVGEAVRYDDFSGDMIDRALMTYLLAGVDVDPSGTSAVASLTEFRDRVRIAKERLSFQSAVGLRGPQPGTTVRLTRAELESLVRESLDGVLAAFDDMLMRNGIWASQVVAVATVGGGARIPLVTQRLSEALRMPVTTTADAQSVAAIGAALIASREPEAVTRVAMASQTGTLLAPAAVPAPPMPVSPAVAAQAWSEADAVDDPAWARPEVVFDHSAAADAAALPPLPWYQRPALLFAVAACAAVFAAVGLVVTTDTDAANASSPLPSASAVPSMSDAGVPATADAAAPSVVTQTLAAAGRPNVGYTQAPQAQRVPAPQAPGPAPQNPPPAPVTTTTSPTTTTTPTTTTSTPTTTTTTTPPTSTSTTTSTSAPPPPPSSTSTSAPPPPPPSSSSEPPPPPPPPSSSAEPPPPSSPPSSSTATVAPQANPPAGS
ncbi:Hsp70 family protein [Mycobacterium sp. URHB0044]|uniref:Hsp70 family protein n=1 Tax=Mycobacterium sp. URHB0044 TaxID=1380386 RepID=UPI00048DE165|nr:Hsp70 family protein [Mycobacterium sp. URHB0044]